MPDDDTAPPARPQPGSLPDALERLLRHFKNNPFDVAEWLNNQHRRGKIPLLGDGIEMAPNSNPGMLGVMARFSPSGKAELYIEVRKALDRNYQNWSFERESFEAIERESFEVHLPGGPENRGGHPVEYNVEDILTEALVYVGVAGRLPDTVGGQGGVLEQLEPRLGPRCPGRTRFHEIFDPIFRRIKAEKNQRQSR
jgi:hypothetical protein